MRRKDQTESFIAVDTTDYDDYDAFDERTPIFDGHSLMQTPLMWAVHNRKDTVALWLVHTKHADVLRAICDYVQAGHSPCQRKKR